MQADGGRTAKRARPIRGGIGRSIVKGTLWEFLRPIICQDRQNGTAKFPTLYRQMPLPIESHQQMFSASSPFMDPGYALRGLSGPSIPLPTNLLPWATASNAARSSAPACALMT